ncbi:vWA domain-containing protein [Saccharicrinis aurantiacus]|uniref:vWA domain-containing protein n=1 Tax=Saccharicrinis aurantiacus TaxID=1849719 RepID=UPI0008FF317A|nr:VWA domain-containing protein [Saccharicrinis aurantiacus]
MQFESPIALFLLPLLLAIVIYRKRKNTASGISMSNDAAMQLINKRQQWYYKLPYILQIATAFFLIFALARPVTTNAKSERKSKGIAMQLVVDISSSMDQNVQIADSSATRMEVAKHVIAGFIKGNDSTFMGRTHDVIGIISFARFANTICPFIMGPDVLVHFVDKLEIEDRPNEDGTAYGDATALAAARLERMDDIYDQQNVQKTDDTSVKSKIIILLTDGENNCGKYQPMAAAALANKWGIKIYTISLQDEPDTQEIEHEGQTIELPEDLSQTDYTLQQMSNLTGGKFWRAHDFGTLNKVYKEIDELEKSDIKTISVIEKKDVFYIFALLALLTLCSEIILRNTLLRKIP